jgi:hypothetical protein
VISFFFVFGFAFFDLFYVIPVDKLFVLHILV